MKSTSWKELNNPSLRFDFTGSDSTGKEVTGDLSAFNRNFL
jgi:hypothetical protein